MSFSSSFSTNSAELSMDEFHKASFWHFWYKFSCFYSTSFSGTVDFSASFCFGLLGVEHRSWSTLRGYFCELCLQWPKNLYILSHSQDRNGYDGKIEMFLTKRQNLQECPTWANSKEGVQKFIDEVKRPKNTWKGKEFCLKFTVHATPYHHIMNSCIHSQIASYLFLSIKGLWTNHQHFFSSHRKVSVVIQITLFVQESHARAQISCDKMFWISNI